MAFFAQTLTLNGSAQQLSSTTKPVTWFRIESDTSNGVVYVGDSTVSATNYGASVTATSPDAVYFGGGDVAKMDFLQIWVLGTNTQKIRIVGNTP